MKVKVTASNTTTIAALTGSDTLRVNAGNTTISASIAANRIVGDRVSASGQGYQGFQGAQGVQGSQGVSDTIIVSDVFTAQSNFGNIVYTLSTTAPAAVNLFVYKNGIALLPNTDYTLANSNQVTIIDTGENGDLIEVRYFSTTAVNAPGPQGAQGFQGPVGTVVFDGGIANTDFSVGININCGGVT